MKKICYYTFATLYLLFSFVPAIAVEIKASADIEVFYERSDDINGVNDDDKFKTNQLYVTFDGKFEPGYFAKLKLDGADIVSSDGGNVTEKIVEEANFTISDLGGSPVTVVFGKDEMPYGLDYDKYLNDSIAHAFEIDKVWGIHGIMKLSDFGNIAVALYEHRNGSDENELTDNYTARVMMDQLIQNLIFEVSFAGEEYVSLTEDLDDETRYSVGIVYKFIDGVNVNFEYNSFQNRKGARDYDPSILTAGLEYKIESFKLFTRYEKIFEDTISDVEENFFMGGVSYTPTKNYTFSLEIANFNSNNLKDAADLNVTDGSLDTAIIGGIHAKF